MAKVLVTGAGGQLGREIAERVAGDENFILADSDMLDICDADAVAETVARHAIDTIINCAAYTAVDRAEEEAARAEAINHRAVAAMATIAREEGIRMVHISTDYVFDGAQCRPYTESDPVHPRSVYGETKLLGEEAMQRIAAPGSVILRTSWVYSSYGDNFVKTMLRLGKARESLGVVYDQIGTPTYAGDLAEAILAILPRLGDQRAEIYHYSDEGVTSWYDFAREIMRMAKLECRIDPIETSEYPTPAKRPHCSLLNKKKIKARFDLTIPYWKDSLDRCLRKMGERR